MNYFLNLLQFLTRITIKKDLDLVDDMGKALVYFPLVGVVIGALMYLVYASLYNLIGIQVVIGIVFIVVLFEAMITGGLHIDGFGDTFDGIFSYRSKERILEIMKDPTMGTNGVVSIVFLIIGKILFIYLAVVNGIDILIFQIPIISRLMPVVLSYKTRSARKNGMGELFIGKCNTKTLIISIAYTYAVVFFSSYIVKGLNLAIISSMVSFILTIFIYFVFKRKVYNKIDGLTGDILGCSVELTELLYIIICVMVNSSIS